MNGFPRITFTETSRKRLGFSCAGLNLLCLGASLVLVALGVYIEIAVKTKINLIKGYNGQYLPVMIIVVGVMLICVNIAGWKICLDSRKVAKRRRQQRVLLVYVTLSSILSVFVEVAGIMCFVQKSRLHESFSAGLRSAMNRYRKDPLIKQEIDWLQLKYQCCGSNAYTDWFSTAWVARKYVDVASPNVERKMTSGKFLNDDVPFSCCSRHVIRPCIHHHVHDNNLHYNYDYKLNTTLNEGGCKEKLVEFYGNQLLKNVGIVVLVISFIQGVLCTAVRFLQTSIDQTLLLNDPTGPAPGWLLTTSCDGTVPDPKLTLEEEEKLLLEQAGYDEDADDGFASDEFDDDFIDEDTDATIRSTEPEMEAVYEEVVEQTYDPRYHDEEPIYVNVAEIADNNQSAYRVARGTRERTHSTYHQVLSNQNRRRPIDKKSASNRQIDTNESAYRVVRRPTNLRLRSSSERLTDDNQSAYRLVPVNRLPSPPEPYRLPRVRTSGNARSQHYGKSRRYQLVEEY